MTVERLNHGNPGLDVRAADKIWTAGRCWQSYSVVGDTKPAFVRFNLATLLFVVWSCRSKTTKETERGRVPCTLRKLMKA
jgi:hypothetical protein